MKNEFTGSIARALANLNLTGALTRFSEAYRSSRAKAYEGIGFAALRRQIAGIKGHAAGRLPELAARFRENAEALGAQVFLASDPQQAREYVLAVARRGGVRRVVKSKSMASEELRLNPFLEQAGLEVTETDLGEWIVQLAGQRPSHMVLPAIHLTREEVADLFRKEAGERLSSDIPRLVAAARARLRPRFLNAELGISGANIAVAETGSLVLVTNEGNARLVATLPRIHIAIVGLEKLVERFDEIYPILTALPRSATSQLLTSYVSVITGPAQNPDGSPKELHIVLLDNRRTEMAADPQFRPALQCIRCASCLNVCPVYRLVGGHVFGKVYTGGIGVILTAWFDALKEAGDIQSLCIQCGQCVEYCPAEIPIPDLILELRRRLAAQQPPPLVERAIYQVVNQRRLFHGLLRAASLAQKPLAKDGFLRHLPWFLSNLTDGRSLPAIAEEPFRDVFPRLAQRPGREKAALYAGCLLDFVYPETGAAMVKVLNRAGIEVVFPEGQTCCGAPARSSGADAVAAQNAIDNIEALLEPEVRYIVSGCPTCTVALQREFRRVLEQTGCHDWLDRAAEVAAKTVDFSTLASRLAAEGRLAFPPGARGGSPVTYHDSCHLKRTLHAEGPPREMLRQSGHELVEMYEADSCCGMGGSYLAKHPEISQAMLARKLAHIEAAGTGRVAADCPGCLLQLRGGLDQRQANIQVKHTAEWLAESLYAGEDG